MVQPDHRVFLASVDIQPAFAPLKTAFPFAAEFQGKDFQYAVKNGSVLIERRRTAFLTDASCPCCGQATGPKETLFRYWLLVDGKFKLVHGSKKSKLAPMRTIGDSFTPTS